MISRREWLQRTVAAGGLLALDPRAVFANPTGLITRTIPGTSEQLPIVGLGSSATFAQVDHLLQHRAQGGDVVTACDLREGG